MIYPKNIIRIHLFLILTTLIAVSSCKKEEKAKVECIPTTAKFYLSSTQQYDEADTLRVDMNCSEYIISSPTGNFPADSTFGYPSFCYEWCCGAIFEEGECLVEYNTSFSSDSTASLHLKKMYFEYDGLGGVSSSLIYDITCYYKKVK